MTDSVLAIEEAKWKNETGLYIELVRNDKPGEASPPHYEVRKEFPETAITRCFHTSMQRHECRAFIKGYIQGYLEALKAEVDRRIEEGK